MCREGVGGRELGDEEVTGVINVVGVSGGRWMSVRDAAEVWRGGWVSRLSRDR